MDTGNSSLAGKIPASGVDPVLLTQRIQESLRQAEQKAASLQRSYNTLNLTGIFSASATTLLTGWTSAAGPVMGSGVSAWRMTCIIAAFLGFITTASMGISQQLRLNDRLSKSNECLGRLKSLDFSILSGSQQWREITTEYAAILRDYPEVLR
jgi:hypothetical protein